MRHDPDSRESPRRGLSHATQRRIARRTIGQALGGVIFLIVAVFTLTGRWSENPNALRRLQQPTSAAAADWYLLSVKTGGITIPFVLSVPRREAQEGEALPEGLIVNGLEEITIGVRRTDTGFEVPFRWLGATLVATKNTDQSISGTWSVTQEDNSTTSYDVQGHSIPDALPERRYPVAPALPEARPVATPLPTRYKIRVGDEIGVLRYRTSTTHAVDVALYTGGKSYGALAGSLYGRLLQASYFDGRRALLLQATLSPDGTTVTGFLSENGAVRNISGTVQSERITIPFQRELTETERHSIKVPSSGPAIVWHTSTFDAAAQRMATGLSRMLQELPSAPPLVIYFHNEQAGYSKRVDAWLTYHGLNANVLRAEQSKLPLPAIAFVEDNGHIVAAYTGLHEPGTGGSYRKQLTNWAAHATELMK